MRSTARAVVIGGGIGGCAALYYLTQEGWTDVVLLERDELTSGTTWHSAAQVTNFGGIQIMVGLKTESIRLYQELANDPEYPINYHHGDGGLRLASEDWHIDGYKHFMSMAKGMGVEFELLDPEECARRHPLISKDRLKGALWDQMDGDIDPAQLCQALARRARKAGAEVHRHTPVTGLTQKPGGEWIVHTSKGDIHAEHIVNAGGYRCNEIGAMMGVQLPVASMEHQYFLTEPIPEIEALDHRVPLLRCPTDDFYSRQEKKGLLIGFYEQDCRTWGLGGIDPNFTNALCPEDTDRVMPVLENVFERMPCITEAGIHTIINGPITYTPDGVPLVGRIGGKRNAWAITGLRAGVGEGGGHGWLLAQMMVHGEAVYDTWALDPRRFGDYANEEYTALKAIEDYQNEFRFHRPHEHRPAGRPLRTTPLTPLLAAAGADFTTVDGWERAAFFKPTPDYEPELTHRWPNWHDVVGKEVEAVHTRVGIAEVNGFNRMEVAGEGVLDWLDGLLCGRVPKTVGKVGLGYFLTEKGNVLGEVTVAVLDERTVWLGSAAAASRHDLDWLKAHLPEDGSITLTPKVTSHTILLLAGPKARAVLAAASERTDWPGFAPLRVQQVHIGHVAVTAMSVSFSGEDAFELHIPMEQSEAVYRSLMAAGAAHDIAHFGAYAVESMRVEMGYRHWKADLITEFDPLESALERFTKLDKSSFPGREALLAKDSAAPRKRFVSLRIGSDALPAHPGDSIVAQGAVIGTVTSAAFGYRTGENLAMGFVDPAHAEVGTSVGLEQLGDVTPCEVVEPLRFKR